MPNDDLELFQQMMDDVKPLAHDVAQLNKPYTITEAQLAKRQTPSSHHVIDARTGLSFHRLRPHAQT